ncbi:hypothetical protein [Photobacterium damselae]|uniref:hypothetical protein n=1 Tax=Photobacterium damselae TaxID=38293 RepID=UPI00406772C4
MSFKKSHWLNEDHDTLKWKEFYLLEQEFYQFLQMNGRTIKSEEFCRAEYKEVLVSTGKSVLAPPLYVRQIISIAKSAIPTALKYSEDLKLAYKDALTDSEREFKKFPSRFPTIVPDIYQINIWRQTATSSKILRKDGDARLCRFFTDSESREQANQVADQLSVNFNIQAKVQKSSIQLRNQDREAAIYVTAPVAELLKHFNVESIRLRRESGTQYRAKCFLSNNDKSPLRLNYGLIITTGEPMVFETIPQPTRAHKTQNVKQALSFDGNLNGQFVELYAEEFDNDNNKD